MQRGPRSLSSRPGYQRRSLNLDLPRSRERLAICLSTKRASRSFPFSGKTPLLSLCFNKRSPPSLSCLRVRPLDAKLRVSTAASIASSSHSVDGEVLQRTFEDILSAHHARLIPARGSTLCLQQPVVASGGIADDDTMPRLWHWALRTLAWIGPWFVASREAAIHARYRERLLGANEQRYGVPGGTLLDAGWPNAPHRIA